MLSQQPRWVVPVVMGGLTVLGLFLSGWAGAVPLAFVALFLGWLLALSWPAVGARGRTTRVLAVLVVAAAAAYRAVG